jgi:glycosyltransferase involved in cell wall biosynthesis
MKLSIIIPVYNEEKTLDILVNKVKIADVLGLEKEIVLVDDGSKDNSPEMLRKYSEQAGIKAIFMTKNSGKGYAVRKGMDTATGDIFIIQDADLEYNPDDYPRLLKPLLDKESQVVYGSRFKSKKGHLKDNKFTYFLHWVGNASLTFITNTLYFTHLTDMETCYKAFTKEAYRKILPLRAIRFDLEPELTAKFLKNGLKIKEVMIDYYSRGFKEGKKITWKDGIKAAYFLIKYRITD